MSQCNLCLPDAQINVLKIVRIVLQILRGSSTGECQNMYKNLVRRIILTQYILPITPRGRLAHDCVQVFREVNSGSMLFTV